MARLRHVQSIDFSKANSKCGKCLGTGVSGQQRHVVGNDEENVPVICTCVVNGGGVKRDALDRAYEHILEQVENGTYVDEQVRLIKQMPTSMQTQMVHRLRGLIARGTIPKKARRLMADVLARVDISQAQKTAQGSDDERKNREDFRERSGCA